VLDPWRFVPEREGVEVVHIGVGAPGREASALDNELAAVAASNGKPAAGVADLAVFSPDA